MKITQPGVYNLTAEQYHADPCIEPSLSHSIAKLIATRSPLHAKRAHPRLGGEPKPGNHLTAIGAAAHALTFGNGADIVVVDAENYRTKAAQEARDQAYARGAIPVLIKEYETARDMAEVARETIAAEFGEGLLNEHTVVAKDDFGSWLRIRPDAMTPDMRVLIDWKTTESAEADWFARRIRQAYATQDAFYRDTLDFLEPAGRGKRRFVFIAQEREYPEAITFHELDAAALDIAQGQMARARAKWAACIMRDEWPAYPRGPYFIAPRQWEIDAELEAQYEERNANG